VARAGLVAREVLAVPEAPVVPVALAAQPAQGHLAVPEALEAQQVPADRAAQDHPAAQAVRAGNCPQQPSQAGQ